jgi:hypothetical protein
MCFKKWFHKPDPVVLFTGKRKALLFAINDYPGGANDLNGCLNDQLDVEAKLNELYPGFEIRKYKDSEVTTTRFMQELSNAILTLVKGDVLLVHYSGHGTQEYDVHGDEADGYDEALYLYDGSLIDNDINKILKNIPAGATVILAFDSCFSGTVTRAMIETDSRFYDQHLPARKAVRKRIAKSSDMRWIVFSGCGEQQTSADAFINGRYNGAFTYYWLKTLDPKLNYADWIIRLNSYLPCSDYDQKPELEGDETLFGKVIFT